jgi:hypothetical protein
LRSFLHSGAEIPGSKTLKQTCKEPVFFGSNREKKAGTYRNNRNFPVISGAKSHDAGESWREKFSSGIDPKQVKNNLQGFWENLYLRRRG